MVLNLHTPPALRLTCRRVWLQEISSNFHISFEQKLEMKAALELSPTCSEIRFVEALSTHLKPLLLFRWWISRVGLCELGCAFGSYECQFLHWPTNTSEQTKTVRHRKCNAHRSRTDQDYTNYNRDDSRRTITAVFSSGSQFYSPSLKVALHALQDRFKPDAEARLGKSFEQGEHKVIEKTHLTLRNVQRCTITQRRHG